MNKKIYFSVPIRGAWGNDASLAYMQQNCSKARQELKLLQELYPDIEWKCPAAHDETVQRLLVKGFVTIDQVLEADAEVQKGCDATLAHKWESSEGVDKEIKLAKNIGHPLQTQEKFVGCGDLKELDVFIEGIRK